MMSLRGRGKPALSPPLELHPPLHCSLPPHRSFSRLVLTPAHCSPERRTLSLVLPVHPPLPLLWTLISVPLPPGTVSPTDPLPLHSPFLLVAGSSHTATLLGTTPSSRAPLLPPTCPFLLVLPPPAHCLSPGRCALPDTISDTHTAHPPCADPTLCSILLRTLIENAERQRAVPLWRRDVSSDSGFSLGPAREKRPLSPHTRLPRAASPAPRPPFPQASHSFPRYLQSPAP